MLLTSSPIHAIDQHAFVNSYIEDYDTKKPRDFKHLIIITINRDIPMIHEHLEAIFKPMGRLVK